MSGTSYQPITGLPASGSAYGPGGTVSATGQVELPDWVNQAALSNYNNAMTLANQPYTAYPGTIVAPMTAAQNQAMTAIQGLQGSTAGTFQTALNNVNNLGATTQSLLNPYLGSVESDTVSNIQRAAALEGQQVAAGAQQSGAYGGSRYGVEQATLDSETQRNIGQAINQIQSQGWNTASQTALNQASLMANLATGGQSAALQSAGALMDVGSTQQQQQQALLSSQLAQWQQQQNWPYQQLAIAQGALAGSPYGTTAVSSQPYTSNALASALSTGATALPAALGLYNQLFGGSSSSPSYSIPGFTPPASPSDIGFPSGDWTTGDDLSTASTGVDTGSFATGSSGLLSNLGNTLSDAASSVGNFIGNIF